MRQQQRQSHSNSQSGEQHSEPHIDFKMLTIAAVVIAGVIAIGGAVSAAKSLFTHKPPVVELNTIPQQQLDRELKSLMQNGIHGSFSIRDYESIDGDGIIMNGSRVVAGSSAITVNASKGALLLKPLMGSEGCSSIEIADSTGVYHLCLEPSDNIKVIVN